MKQYTPKYLAVASASAAIALILSGCSGTSGATESGGPGGSVNLTFWTQWGAGSNQTLLNHVISTYEKSHPGIHITTSNVSDSAKILAAISSGNPPDMIDLGTSLNMGAWASKGALLPLDSYVTKSKLDKSQYVPSSVDAVTVTGKLYGLPFMNFNSGLLYNKTLFKKAGIANPPSTLPELYQDASKLTKARSDGTIEQLGFLPAYPGASNGQTCTLETLGWAFGGQWVGSDGKPTADTPQIVQALTWEDSFYKKFGASKMASFEKSAGAYLTNTDPLSSGKLAMQLDGPWVLAHMQAGDPTMVPNIGLAPFPGSTPGQEGTSFLDTNPQVIPRGSAHAQAAFDFLKWETTSQSMTDYFANGAQNLPQLKNVPDPKYNGAKIFVDEANSANAHVWPQTPYSSAYQTSLCAVENSVVLGQLSPAAGAKELQKDAAAAQAAG